MRRQSVPKALVVGKLVGSRAVGCWVGDRVVELEARTAGLAGAWYRRAHHSKSDGSPEECPNISRIQVGEYNDVQGYWDDVRKALASPLSYETDNQVNTPKIMSR